MDKEIGNMASAITAAWFFTGMVAFGWIYAKDADFAKIVHKDPFGSFFITVSLWPIGAGILIWKWMTRK